MTDVNWNIFRIKFTGRENAAFERLAYMLFCYEYNIRVGIFRFKNQTGIETEPIEAGTEYVAFQAKFYDTKLADNKTDIIDSINKAKGKNASLTRILVYINQEFSESPKRQQKKPQYQVDIEKAAKQINVTIEWRVPSHIEKQLTEQENKYLLEFFFSNAPGATDFINNIYEHSKNIIFAVNGDISYRAGHITIDRSDYVKQILQSTSKIVILAGDGGSGKTAIIKSILSNAQAPFYILKAIEFDGQTLHDIFSQFGNFTFQDFLHAHSDEPKKTFVIDSAEKLADLDDLEVFTEFLSALVQHNWQIIFTTRHTYLEDLTFQMISIYRLPFETIKLPNLAPEELEALSKKYGFPLLQDAKLTSIIRNLFYLNEYLQDVDGIQNNISVHAFRNVLWNKKIQNSKSRKNNIHLEREKCFLAIARRRSESGIFFVPADIGDPHILSLLAADEIIKYEASKSGYFIAHDIYEEWALEKIIDNAYNQETTNAAFFASIGSALATRRAFRSWLSNKLQDKSPDIKIFIDGIYHDSQTAEFWKDEVLISVLLSEYATEFFSANISSLFANEKRLLQKLIFLLRIACKEVDETMQRLLTSTKNDTISLANVFTKPKGTGWQTVIRILSTAIDQITKEDLHYVLPLLEDWVAAHKFGDTTREAGQFALHFYKDAEADNGNYYGSDTEELLLKIVLMCSRELVAELTEITHSITKRRSNERGEYRNLQEAVLTSCNTSLPFIICMPDNTMKLARKAWIRAAKTSNPFYESSIGVDKYYGLATEHQYFPASALQTPVYYLLHFATEQAIDFVLEIVNTAITTYANNGWDESVYKTRFMIDEEVFEQYASRSIWQMYRGSGSPVSPYMLQSIHMALEKYLLERAKHAGANTIRPVLLKLLRESRSASITAVVASVVLANAQDLFDIAIILFGNYDFLKLDNVRLSEEYHAMRLYTIGSGLNGKNRMYEEERVATGSDIQRKNSLEHQAIHYQFFRDEKINEDEAEARKLRIWEIIDKNNEALATSDNENAMAKRLLYKRIDRRVMNPIISSENGGIQINFNPALGDDLEQFSETGMQEFNQQFKYTPLKMWALYQFDNNKGKGDYTQFENKPLVVLEETRQLMSEPRDQNTIFYYSYQEVPAYACAALLKLHADELSEEDLQFCIDVTLEYATAPLQEGYNYQISDGVEAAISTLPYIVKISPALADDCCSILLSILFDEYPIGHYKRVCDYAIEAICHTLFRFDSARADEIIAAYTLLKPQFDTWQELHAKERRSRQHAELIRNFFEEIKPQYEKTDSFLDGFDLAAIDALSVANQEFIFQCIPFDTVSTLHLDIIQKILNKCGREVVGDQRQMGSREKYEHGLKNRFCKKYAVFLLQRKGDDLQRWLDPIFEPFVPTEQAAHLIGDIVSAEDIDPVYDSFWTIWKYIYSKLKDSIADKLLSNRSEIISNFMLAWPYWKETAKSWHSLKEQDAQFFRQACKETGAHPRVLYSISKFLNEIGSDFVDQGALWISDMISDNSNYQNVEIDANTIYYMELIARRYVYANRTKLRSNYLLKEKIVVLLNFLVSKGSVNAYLLREDIV